MKGTILLFGAGKSATVLIERLLEMSAAYDWQLIVADVNLPLAESKIGGSEYGIAQAMQMEDDASRRMAISKADLVISLLPPALHFLVARDCLEEAKDLLTASYVDENLWSLSNAARDKGLIFLGEMGLDPGIDHMSAMRLIKQIQAAGGKITSFASHCGGLVAPESDDNPWHYKVSWNPSSVVSAGSGGALFRKSGAAISVSYQEVFAQEHRLEFPGLGVWACYPNRDSTRYISQYGLNDIQDFVRTTIRHPNFMEGWAALIKAGLTGTALLPKSRCSFAEWSRPILSLITFENRPLFDYLGLFSQDQIPGTAHSSAAVLQHLIEQRLALKTDDKDMVLMLHQIEYVLDGESRRAESSMKFIGLNANYTAMATTVGLPLAYAAKLILLQRPKVSGVVLPSDESILQAVLPELEKEGIIFQETHRTI